MELADSELYTAQPPVAPADQAGAADNRHIM